MQTEIIRLFILIQDIQQTGSNSLVILIDTYQEAHKKEASEHILLSLDKATLMWKKRLSGGRNYLLETLTVTLVGRYIM